MPVVLDKDSGAWTIEVKEIGTGAGQLRHPPQPTYKGRPRHLPLHRRADPIRLHQGDGPAGEDGERPLRRRPENGHRPALPSGRAARPGGAGRRRSRACPAAPRVGTEQHHPDGASAPGRQDQGTPQRGHYSLGRHVLPPAAPRHGRAGGGAGPLAPRDHRRRGRRGRRGDRPPPRVRARQVRELQLQRGEVGEHHRRGEGPLRPPRLRLQGDVRGDGGVRGGERAGVGDRERGGGVAEAGQAPAGKRGAPRLHHPRRRRKPPAPGRRERHRRGGGSALCGQRAVWRAGRLLLRVAEAHPGPPPPRVVQHLPVQPRGERRRSSTWRGTGRTAPSPPPRRGSAPTRSTSSGWPRSSGRRTGCCARTAC